MNKIITITVEGGVVVQVHGLPKDWSYRIDDRDYDDEGMMEKRNSFKLNN